ncbi:Crp/Fnr family transcriptional regulator [Dyadobacter subterraneus]|uniref:Crp/Fnr family transcriptional regulator n=1 Tax=Dyadobacter subterraneus TaxID=2773304 RepID=A0ABR9W8K9_9BACT|nr:Crp/Fnr family transcriptional regulator [Dyadobacter subterraneus]MBE9461800.1 Crp/Fnr family transcriptional regulator [Dyadobacter subterraneus]
MENLYIYIKSIIQLSEQGWSALQMVLSTRYFTKGEYLLKTGEICHSLFYIETGYCRAWHDYGGQTINTNFYFENEFATNIRSMKLGIGSEYFIQAEEDMKVIIFDKEKLYELFSRSVEVDTMDRKLMEEILRRQEKQAYLFKLHTARERYEYMCKIQPQIIKRVPLIHIASYLGIRIETLTKIHNAAK